MTEFADANVNLKDSQTFYNQSSSYLDRTEYIHHGRRTFSQTINQYCRNITRYSYFGAFRSDVSNVGPNSAMLTQDGKLTDIGSFYLGGGKIGTVPKGEAADRKTASGLMLTLAFIWYLL